MRRFVILHHTLSHGEHWDLMIEQGEHLATWQLHRDPLQAGDAPIPALRISDHRLAYLDYEGPVSRGRGEVTRIAAGSCEILSCDPELWVVIFKGAVWQGRFQWDAESAFWQPCPHAD
jgi:hypothetical protein